MIKSIFSYGQFSQAVSLNLTKILKKITNYLLVVLVVLTVVVKGQLGEVEVPFSVILINYLYSSKGMF